MPLMINTCMPLMINTIRYYFPAACPDLCFHEQVHNMAGITAGDAVIEKEGFASMYCVEQNFCQRVDIVL
jgi:hypothetical protein